LHPLQTELADLRRELDEAKASLSKAQKELVAAQAEVTRLKALEEDMQDNKKGKKDTVGGIFMSLRGWLWDNLLPATISALLPPSAGNSKEEGRAARDAAYRKYKAEDENADDEGQA
jgi:hypothetical protein